MKLAVSNIGWPQAAEDEVLSTFLRIGIPGVEVAPTRIWPDWSEASPSAATLVAQDLTRKKLSVPALQAILFGKPELNLFGSDSDRDLLLSHLDTVAELASAFGAKSLVFGAPKNRQLGNLTAAAGFEIARDFFRKVAPSYEQRDVSLCLEANPTQYGCTFITNSAEAARLVRAVDSPGFGLHLDTACMFLAGEDVNAAITNNVDILRHFHVSEPFLGSFSNPQIDHSHIAAILRGARYGEWISLEMRETEDSVSDVKHAAEFLARTYTRES